MKVPNGSVFGDGSAQARKHGDHRGQLPQIFLCPKNFFMLRKIYFKHIKNKGRKRFNHYHELIIKLTSVKITGLTSAVTLMLSKQRNRL